MYFSIRQTRLQRLNQAISFMSHPKILLFNTLTLYKKYVSMKMRRFMWEEGGGTGVRRQCI